MSEDIYNFEELQKAIILLGGKEATGRLLKITGAAVAKWLKTGMPRSEWTGETCYAHRIEKSTCGEIKAANLLAFGRTKANKPID